jgi:hypothetical protein
MKFSSVVGYHMSPLTCGVAKFNVELARRLGVPFSGLFSGSEFGALPLLSLKWSELHSGNARYLRAMVAGCRYGVFWHDAGDPGTTANAVHVFYADPSLGPNGLFCPSLLPPSKPRTVRLFSFGMASKMQPHRFARVRQLLEADGLDHHLRVSVGLHEGTSLSDATHHFDALKEIMGEDKVTILGILSDEAVMQELQQADYVLAFFEHGLRANNTTVHAALQANKIVISNHDDHTPGFLKAATRDIVTRAEWERTIPYYYSWDTLLLRMQEIYDATAPDRHAHR